MQESGSVLVSRVFAAAGIPAPPAGTPFARAMARCPRARLVRVVAWYAWECGRGLPSGGYLAEGMRVLVRGWDDYYPTLSLPSGASFVNVEGAAIPGAALVTRHARMGRGWLKESVSIRGEVRPEVELGARWLDAVIGCIVHDDCAAIPELGIACAGAERA